ncbi:PAS domain-containing protein [Anaerotruncus rubiinfantis]|uniref:PAS domain-containing protein n=1 Tax=Anaerotruncus rubiinfantis TaxID=1720200 RepID=UPI0034A3AA59
MRLAHELETLLSSIPSGLCVYRLEGGQIRPVFHNSAFCTVLGFSDEHIFQDGQELSFSNIYEEDLPTLREKICGLMKNSAGMSHTFRVFNDRMGEYRWLHVEVSAKQQGDGLFFYAVYSDVSEQVRLERDLTDTNGKMGDIINAIPGGVAIYKVSDIFETVYFSDGVPQLSGYTVAEYREMVKCDAAEMTYWEDTGMVVSRAREVIRTRGVDELEFRKRHRDGHIVWVRAQVKWIGEEDGCALLHCVFHNISDLKEAQLEMEHLVNSIPGGIASYRVEGNRFIPTFYSDGVMVLSGHTREEYEELARDNALDIIYEPDRERVLAAARAAVLSGEVLDVSYRMHHKDGSLIWIHLNGRRLGPLSESTRFYAVFTGMSAQTHLFQNIANETADGIYVIAKENYELLYVNESKALFLKESDCIGKKCYAAMHGKDAPCEFCTLNSHAADAQEHEMPVDGTDRFYKTRFREADWNGIPAYIKYVRDVTEEVRTRKDKERLEMYFRTVVSNLPGGISVIRCDPDGNMTQEFISDGFAAMTHMTAAQVSGLYGRDIFTGFHPGDVPALREKLQAYAKKGEGHCELAGRIKRGDGRGYVWVKCTLSLLQTEDGVHRIYAVYTDMTAAVREQEKIRQQYKEMLLQHYRTPGPNALILGHCNVTQNRILEIIDHTDSNLMKVFGTNRENFFTRLSDMIVGQEDRSSFLNTYLNAPTLAAFSRGDTERIMVCFVRLPKEETGRYVQFKVNLVETPDTGDVTGILTVTDVTEQAISERILRQLSVTGHDFIVDVDLLRDRYTILSCIEDTGSVPPRQGRHSEWIQKMGNCKVVPKDREQYLRGLDPVRMPERLKREGAYTFAFSVVDDNGDIRTKNMTVSAVDLRLGRICLSRTDITDSIREQQGLLHMIAYTFELAGFINVGSGRLTMHTRQTVLENLAPYIVEQYDHAVAYFAGRYGVEKDGEAGEQFCLETMLRRLHEKPEGYDFVFPYHADDGLRYKQINVLWGDQNHRTICMVRADVTDMLAAERETKRNLEDALTQARNANRAKSDFLSAMSHDIRTPMNAIMGMTTLAAAYIDDPERVKDCLQKISASSQHLLSLINDVLDMSKIEQSKIALNRMYVTLADLVGQLSSIMAPQARAAGVLLDVRIADVSHRSFYGDGLRINQILLNILSNAVKFTPEGGRVDFLIEEVSPARHTGWVRYRFTVKDTGIGIPEEFLAHIFDPFIRSTLVARIEGTGLGLSIAKGLVDLMEGSISVESTVNKGSAFYVELECEPAPAGADPCPDAAGSRLFQIKADRLLCGCRFLVAEDNAINAEILCELLRLFGADSVVKADGAQAVREFRDAPEGTYDAILMDIQMPEMNGYEAARAIRRMERAQAKTIPIVAMTANAFAEDVQAALQAGMDAHVAKPLDVNVLRSVLSKVLGKGMPDRSLQ